MSKAYDSLVEEPRLQEFWEKNKVYGFAANEADDCPARYSHRLETGIQDNGPILLQTHTTIIHQTLQHRPPIPGRASRELVPTVRDSNSRGRSRAPGTTQRTVLHRVRPGRSET